MLEKEFFYYLENQKEFVKKYNGKILVIIGNEIVGVYPDRTTALNESIKKYELGTFLIQKCSSGNSSTTHTFHTRVI